MFYIFILVGPQANPIDVYISTSTPSRCFLTGSYWVRGFQNPPGRWGVLQGALFDEAQASPARAVGHR